MRYNLHYRVGASNWKGWKHLGQWETLSEAQDELQSWQNPIRPSHGDVARIVSVKKDGALKPSKNEWAKNMPLYVFNESEWIPAAHLRSGDARHWVNAWESQNTAASIMIRYTEGVPGGFIERACIDLVDLIPRSLRAIFSNEDYEWFLSTLYRIHQCHRNPGVETVANIGAELDSLRIRTGRPLGRTNIIAVERLNAVKALTDVLCARTSSSASALAQFVGRVLDMQGRYDQGHNQYLLRATVWKHITMSHAICGAMGLSQPTY